MQVTSKDLHTNQLADVSRAIGVLNCMVVPSSTSMPVSRRSVVFSGKKHKQNYERQLKAGTLAPVADPTKVSHTVFAASSLL